MNATHSAIPEVLAPFTASISFNAEDQQANVKMVAEKMAHLYAKCLTVEGYGERSQKFTFDIIPSSTFPAQEEVDLFEKELAKTIEEKLMPGSSGIIESSSKLSTLSLKTSARPEKLLKEVLQRCGIWVMPKQPFYFPHQCTNHIFLYSGSKIDIVVVNV